jgi:tRNA pseudouridine32 synthase/23S rRNA pseudouridine746 synthase
VFDGLCAQFSAIDRETWRRRIERGCVLDADGIPITLQAPYRVGACIRYFREVAHEPRVPFVESLVHVDADLVVADKPHFLPVTPSGPHVEETLLARLIRRLGNADLVPLHRIDRATAGLVLFSANPATRARYQALFRERRIEKRYEALAPALPRLEFPHLRQTRLARAEPFFRMQEIPGEPNAATRVDVMQRDGSTWRYALQPATGRKHQLRVHMAALGAPILNDELYPSLAMAEERDDYSRPLKLLARGLSFVDPLSGLERRFESGLAL